MIIEQFLSMDMEEAKKQLMRADLLACRIVNQLKNEDKCDLAQALLVTAVMYGRLRAQAEELDTALLKLDTLFLIQADVITSEIKNNEPGPSEKVN